MEWGKKKANTKTVHDLPSAFSFVFSCSFKGAF